MIVEGVAYGEDCGLIFCGVKPRLAVASNQTKLSVSAIVNVSMSVEKWILTGYLLKVAANCAILGNQKLTHSAREYFEKLAFKKEQKTPQL